MTRISSYAFPTFYAAVIHRDGEHDEFLSGEDGKPLRFRSATEAIRAGRKAFQPCLAEMSAGDPLGIADWRKRRDQDRAEERRRVFGDDQPRSTRTIVIERRRRR
jgi:hypothetical protein